MHFEPSHIYHLYNGGNRNQTIFLNEDNYEYFLRKVNMEWKPFCDILNYNLLPTHFQFLVVTNHAACKYAILKNRLSHLQALSAAIGKTLSSYTRARNIQQNTTGTLFQKKTKCKLLTELPVNSPLFKLPETVKARFQEIHFYPQRARLVTSISDWPYSSWMEWAGLRENPICNLQLACRLLNLNIGDLQLQR